MGEEINTLTPFVTLNDIMRVFSCEIDKAREIMNFPDLEKFPVGRTYYVARTNWDRFINNLIKYHGARDLTKGFAFVNDVPESYAWDQLIAAGFTEDELEDVIFDIVKEKEKSVKDGEEEGTGN